MCIQASPAIVIESVGSGQGHAIVANQVSTIPAVNWARTTASLNIIIGSDIIPVDRACGIHIQACACAIRPIDINIVQGYVPTRVDHIKTIKKVAIKCAVRDGYTACPGGIDTSAAIVGRDISQADGAV